MKNKLIIAPNLSTDKIGWLGAFSKEKVESSFLRTYYFQEMQN